MSPSWILLELRMMEMVVTTGAVRLAELQSNHCHQQTNFLQARSSGCSSCWPPSSVKAVKGNLSILSDIDVFSEFNSAIIFPNASNRYCLKTFAAWPYWLDAGRLYSPFVCSWWEMWFDHCMICQNGVFCSDFISWKLHATIEMHLVFGIASCASGRTFGL